MITNKGNIESTYLGLSIDKNINGEDCLCIDLYGKGHYYEIVIESYKELDRLAVEFKKMSDWLKMKAKEHKEKEKKLNKKK